MLIDVNPGDYIFANVAVLGAFDGDTVYLDIDVGFHQHRDSRNLDGRTTTSYRLLDIDAPELRPLITRQAATEARDYLLGLIAGRRLIVQTLQDPDNFGRYLIHVWLPDGTSVNRAMIDSGHAVPYVH